MNVKVKILGAALLLLTAACGNDSDEDSVLGSTSTTSSDSDGYINGHEYVDLGLSVKWATCNVGSLYPWGSGDYFAWGETSPKDKYTNSTTYGKDMSDIAGDPQYDAARANWGGTWRMPTADEIDELVDNCQKVWTTMEEQPGYKVIGPNGNSIFLPAAGYHDGTSLDLAGECGYYWSATPYESNTDRAYDLDFCSSDFDRIGGSHFLRYWGYRGLGQPVRPVSE